jgi:hypothetical protein
MQGRETSATNDSSMAGVVYPLWWRGDFDHGMRSGAEHLGRSDLKVMTVSKMSHIGLLIGASVPRNSLGRNSVEYRTYACKD